MRMIDADALMRKFADYVRASNNSDFADAPTWNDAVSFVDSAPTIEAEPVKHGRWKPYPIADNCWQCSVCGVLRITYANYCPNCGAKMDL